MNIEELISQISAKYSDSYLDGKANHLREGLEKITPGIKKSLEDFLQSDEKQDVSLLGYSLDKLMSEHGMNEVAAYLTLDWLIREPDQALAALAKGVK